jgi:CheY-like chemotaxis protein
LIASRINSKYLAEASMARILIVDDDEALRATMRRMLQASGHEVIEAGDGERALVLAAKHPPDQAVCDLYMSVREGFETIRELRRGFPKFEGAEERV